MFSRSSSPDTDTVGGLKLNSSRVLRNSVDEFGSGSSRIQNNLHVEIQTRFKNSDPYPDWIRILNKYLFSQQKYVTYEDLKISIILFLIYNKTGSISAQPFLYSDWPQLTALFTDPMFQPCFNSDHVSRPITHLKGLSHETEMNYKWYKFTGPNWKLNVL
jgi:hypothetical protein